MSASYSIDDLVEVWRQVTDPSYRDPLEQEDDGRSMDLIYGMAAMFARVSDAVLKSTQALYFRPHSQQLAPSASGDVRAMGLALLYRGNVIGGPLPFDDGEPIDALFWGPNGEDENHPRLEIIGDVTVQPGSAGPTAFQVRAARPGFQGNVPPGTEGGFPEASTATFLVAGYSQLTNEVNVNPSAGDGFTPAMRGAIFEFTDGINASAPPSRLDFITDMFTAVLDYAPSVVSQSTSHAKLVSATEVLNPRIVFPNGVSGGRSAELDLLASERLPGGRLEGESDEQLSRRAVRTPDLITPNAMLHAIEAALTPFDLVFLLFEPFSQGVGFFFDDGTDSVDAAYDDPFSYRRGAFYVGPAVPNGMVPRGVIVVMDGTSFPPEPDLTRALAAVTSAIEATRAHGIPWTIAFEPPIPVL